MNSGILCLFDFFLNTFLSCRCQIYYPVLSMFCLSDELANHNDFNFFFNFQAKLSLLWRKNTGKVLGSMSKTVKNI